MDLAWTASNLDGSRIINSSAMEGYILERCSTTTTPTCTSPSHCPAGETCLFSVGNHSAGFIKLLTHVFASTWTPFSEGFYDAIGYFAQRTDTRINTSADPILRDFTTEAENAGSRIQSPRNPLARVLYRFLIISILCLNGKIS